jgi:hypothetical protein
MTHRRQLPNRRARRLNKSVPFGRVEPLHGAVGHTQTPIWQDGTLTVRGTFDRFIRDALGRTTQAEQPSQAFAVSGMTFFEV